MAERTFIINAPINRVQSIITDFFTREGWTCTPSTTGGIHLNRGNKGLTIALGALALGSFYLSQDVDLTTGPQGDDSGLPPINGQGAHRWGDRRAQVYEDTRRVRREAHPGPAVPGHPPGTAIACASTGTFSSLTDENFRDDTEPRRL